MENFTAVLTLTKGETLEKIVYISQWDTGDNYAFKIAHTVGQWIVECKPINTTQLALLSAMRMSAEFTVGVDTLKNLCDERRMTNNVTMHTLRVILFTRENLTIACEYNYLEKG